MFYNVCPECGAALDPGEKCDCQKKEACTGGAVQATRQMPLKNSLINYTTEKEECQDVKSNRAQHTADEEIRQQVQFRELPVYLL